MASIDLNADLGEGDPYDAELLSIVSSCNIACGGHAGDEESMKTTIELALDNGVAIGAHPSYPDREGFGRRSGFMAASVLAEPLREQLRNFNDVAAGLGAVVSHVKPHGALYNDAANDEALAEVVAETVADMPGHCALVGQPSSALERAAQAQGILFIAEAFVDRAYLADGRLVPRSESGAVYDDPEAMAAQAIALAVTQRVTSIDAQSIEVRADTLCIHGDTPNAPDAARAVRDALEARGVTIAVPDVTR